jgi:ATP-dependent DNA ligase
MNVTEILDELEAHNSRLVKENILERNVDNELLKKVFVAALDPYVNYGVAKFKMPKPNNFLFDVDASDDHVDGFLSLLSRLQFRDLSGNAAKNEVENFFGTMTTSEQKWCKRILLKNLRCGVQGTTVNKTWPELIKSFSVQLAVTLKTSVDENGNVKIDERVQYPVRVEHKLDGLRCFAVKNHGEVIFYTRNGREITTLHKIKDAIEKCPLDNVIFDGEVLGADWNESASVVGSKKNNKSDANVKFHVFDTLTVTEWMTDNVKLPLSERITLFNDSVSQINSPFVVAITGTLVSNETELIAYYLKSLDEGHEGIMLKNLSSLYEFDRSKNVKKMKPVETYEGVIVGWKEGRDDTRNAGGFGKFEVLLSNGVVTKVGSGFSDVLRAEIMTAGPASYYRKIVECEAQPPLTTDGKMRFPVFVRFRDASDVDPAIMSAYENYKS